MSDHLLNISQAAKKLGVAAVTLRLWERQGKIKSLRTSGNQRRYSLEMLEGFLQTQNSNSQIHKSNSNSQNFKLQTPTSNFHLQALSSPLIAPLQKKVLGFVLAAIILATGGTVATKNTKILNFFKPPTSAVSEGSVLAAETINDDYRFVVNVPTLFNKDITAPNVIYGLVAGENITVSAGQNPTISSVLPDQFKNFKVGSTTITAGSKTDTLELVAGSNVTLSTSDKKITIASAVTDVTTSGITDDGTMVRLTTATDNFGLGAATGAAKLNLNVDDTRDLITASQSGSLKFRLTSAGIIDTGVWNGTAIANAYLANSSLTVSAGTGLSGGGSVSLGGSVTLSNSGVLSLTGTTDQVNVSGSTGAITLSLPQSIATTSSPTFDGLTVSAGQISNTELANSVVTVTAGTGLSGGGSVSLGSSVTLSLPTVTTALGGTNITSYTTGDILYSSATNTLAKLGIGSTDQILVVSGGIPAWVSNPSAPSSGTFGYWSRTGTTLSPANSGDSLSLAGNATTSGILTFTGTAAQMGTVNMRTLTLGTATTGNIVIDSGSGSIALSDNTTFSGNIDVAGSTTLNGSFTLGDAGDTGSIGTSDWTINTSGDMAGIGAITANGAINFTGTSALANVNIAADADIIPVTVTGTNDLGSTSSPWDNLYITNVYPQGTSGTIGWLQRNAGTLSPLNITDDFILGATATASAKFQISGTTGNASTSGNLIFSTAATIATTAMQTLTLGDANTGNIVTAKNISATGTLTGLTGLTVASGTVSLPSGQIDNAELAGSITAAKLVGTDIATVGTITSGVWNGTKVSEVYGGTNQSTYTTGDILYSSATNTLAKLGIGGANQVLAVSSGIPGWVDSSSLADSTWQRLLGVVSPRNITDDLSIGGTATSSSKFQIFGLTGNATSAGNLTFNTAATIATTAMQTLTLGDANTGIVDIASNIKLRTSSFQMTTGAASGYTLTSDASGNSSWTNIGTDAAAGPWTLSGGVTFPDVATYNVLVGSATAADGVAPLTVSGFETGKALVILNETGDQNILTASQSGIPVFNLARVAGTAANGVTFTGATTTNGPTLASTGSDTNIAFSIDAKGSGALNLNNTGTGDILVGGGSASTGCTITNSTGNIVCNNLSGTNTGDQTITLTGDVTGTGTGSFATTIGALKVTNAMLAGSITAAKLVGTDITTVGTITTGTWNGIKISEIYGGTNQSAYTTGDILYASGTNTLAKLGIGSTSQVLTVSGGIPAWGAAANSSPWNQTAGAIVPANTTVDVLIGSTASDSAKFAFINVNSGTPTASVSGDLTLNAAGVIRTTNKQTLTIGDANTGNIVLDSGSGKITLSDDITASGGLTVAGATVLNGSFTLGDNGDTGSINTSDWDITTTGDMTGIGAITADGVLTVSSSATISGALTLYGTATLQGTALQTLTLGGSTTGNIVIDSGSGVINLPDLTASRAIFTDASSNLSSVGASADLLNSLSDETGTGVAVFGTSPAITTSLTTGSTTFALVNTTATTVNFAGASTTLSIGAATGTTTVNNALTVAGAFTLGDNGDLGAIDTSDWNITATGDLSGIGTIAADGNITQSGATTFTTGTGTVTVAGAATVSASLAFGPQSAAPATCNSANEGRVYYSGTTGTKRLYVCDGTTWIPIAAGTLTGGASYQTISPEYPSAIISADGSSNVGTLTSDREATGSGSLYSFNYYEFASGQTSLQDYDVYARWEVPENFTSWATSNAITIDYATEDTSSANNKIDIQITKENDADTVTSSSNVSPTAGKWQSSILSSSPISFTAAQMTSAITWTAGDVAIIRIRLFSKDNYFARVGAIKFDWQ